MDGEEELCRISEDLLFGANGSIESRRREVKASCLKIEGQDGYVFKSYSINPHDDSKSLACSSTLDKDVLPCFHFTSQMDKRLEIDLSCNADPVSPNANGNGEIGKYQNGNESSELATDDIEDEMGAGAQEDERLVFGNSIGPFATKDVDDYSNLLSGYTSTLYDVAMDAVTQSLLSSIRGQPNPRKKSPAWNHFCISPRDSTKAICLYCMKEFSRGKNEKDLSTSCLMRHVRRAHPTVLIQDGADMSFSNLPASFASPFLPFPPSSPKNGDLTNGVLNPASKDSSPSTSSAENLDPSSKETLPKDEPKLHLCPNDAPGVDSLCAALLPSHSIENIVEELSEGGSERLPGTPKGSSSRRRSAVWKHFYLSPADNSKAVCIHCMNEFSRGKNGKDLGTSCLIRHMWRAHKEVVIEENGQGNHIPLPYTNPPSLLSRAHPHDSFDLKKEPSFFPSSPETLVDDLPQSIEDSVDIKKECEEMMQLSGQEASLSLFRTQEDDISLGPSASDLGEGPSLSRDHAVFQQNKKLMKRLKSGVWRHFIVSPDDRLKALCRYCPCVIGRGKRGEFGTSCLMRHLVKHHPDIVKNQKIPDGKDSDLLAGFLAADPVCAKETEAPDPVAKPLLAINKRTSKLWNHFSISPNDPTKVVCLHCNRTISRGKKSTNLGTSCLYRHVQRFHGHVLDGNRALSGDARSAEVSVKQEAVESPVYETETNAGRFDPEHPVAKKITKLVAEMLALDLQPSAVVENSGLSRLLEYLKPQYSLPPSSYFTSTAIPDMYDKVKEVVSTHLKEAEGGVVHFSASIWVSSQTREYLTLTAHWATYESSLRPPGQDFHCSALLSVSQIDCDQDMHDIPKQLEYLWDSWITSSGLKRGFTLTDNITVKLSLEERGHPVMECFGHTVDLIVSEAIKSQRMVQNLLSIARKICERVHRSAKAKEKLAELQRAHRLPDNQLIQDVPSKWRTSLFMLERLVEQKAAVDELSVECNFREIISCDQWEVMLSVCNALKPFEVACAEMSSRTATLGQVIPLVHILNRKIDLLFDETVGVDNMLRSLKEALLGRMSATLHDRRYAWATMLDPRYKTSLFTEEEAEQCKQDLILELDLSTATSPRADPQLPNGHGDDPSSGASSSFPGTDDIWNLMGDVRQRKPEEKSSELAVLEYLEEDILDQSCDPLDYWNLKKFLWPDLAKVAARYVGCPPSIVPAETLFSTASVNCALNQSRQTLDNVEGLLFLKVNLPLIYFQY